MTGPARRVAFGGAVLGGTSVAAVFGYVLAGWDWLDAMYMVVITVFGVGYGEVRTMDPSMRVFTIVVILVGCSSLIYIRGDLFQMITEGGLNRALGKRKMPTKIGAERLAQIVSRPHVLEFFDQADLGAVGQELASIGVELDEFETTTAMIGRTVGEIESCGSGGFMVVAVRRVGGSIVRNPDKEFSLAEQDRILLLGHRENLPDLQRLFRVRLSPVLYRGAFLRR